MEIGATPPMVDDIAEEFPHEFRGIDSGAGSSGQDRSTACSRQSGRRLIDQRLGDLAAPCEPAGLYFPGEEFQPGTGTGRSIISRTISGFSLWRPVGFRSSCADHARRTDHPYPPAPLSAGFRGSYANSCLVRELLV